MQPTVHPSLQSTVDMLRKAFPNGIPPQELLSVLRLLYDNMSDRNLAFVASVLTEQPSEVMLNKVYDAAGLSADDPRVLRMRDHLKQYGYDDWLTE
jgi:hypothetical protein